MDTTETAKLDVIVIGGGAAGISAALWCDDLGLRVVLFEESGELGGQLLWTYNRIDNYPGVNAENGRELRDIFLKHAAPRNLNFVAGSKVSKIDLAKREVVLDSGHGYSSRAIIIATGIRRRKLGVEGEDRFIGRGILESGKRDAESAAGKHVCVVGGGDAALENALIMAEKATAVTLIHRSERFSARQEFLDQARSNEKIKILTNSKIERVIGDERLDSIEVKDLLTEEKHTHKVDNLLIRAGVEPNSEPFRGQVRTDEKGYIEVDSTCQTSIANAFAVGDVANPVSPTVATAVGMGATAAKAAYLCLNK